MLPPIRRAVHCPAAPGRMPDRGPVPPAGRERAQPLRIVRQRACERCGPGRVRQRAAHRARQTAGARRRLVPWTRRRCEHPAAPRAMAEAMMAATGRRTPVVRSPAAGQQTEHGRNNAGARADTPHALHEARGTGRSAFHCGGRHGLGRVCVGGRCMLNTRPTPAHGVGRERGSICMTAGCGDRTGLRVRKTASPSRIPARARSGRLSRPAALACGPAASGSRMEDPVPPEGARREAADGARRPPLPAAQVL